MIVPPGTPGGSYTLRYRICDRMAPTNCSDAAIRFAVSDDALLHVNKQAAPQKVNVGDVVRYTLTVQNPARPTSRAPFWWIRRRSALA